MAETCYGPLIVKMVLASVKVLQPRQQVNLGKVLFPRDGRGLVGIQVDPDEAKIVLVDVHLEQAIGRLVKGRELFIIWSLGQLPVEAI